MDRLARSLEIDRRVTLRGAQVRTEIAGGWVIGHAGMPNSYTLNAILMTSPASPSLDADQLEALADRWLGHLSHRLVRLDDAAAAERLSADLLRRGWQRQRTLLMVHQGTGAELVSDPRAREISDSELNAAMLTDFEQTRFGTEFFPGLPEMLVAGQAALRAGTPAQGYAAGVNGGLQSVCTLFMDADVDGQRVAMIDQVSTLPAFRERGLAKAAVSAAVRAAMDWEAELIVIPTDVDDWPQLLYAGLGFEGVGQHVTFQRQVRETGT